MMAVADTQGPNLPGMIETSDDGDRPSITEVNGTVARFEMAYNPNPEDRFAFGPPILQRLPSLLFVGFAATLAIAAGLAQNASTSPSLHKFIVTEGRMPLVIIICLAAVATFVRSGLRGVIVTADSVETRQLSMGFPRVRRYRWAQIDRIILDKDSVLFELWNGEYERLPKVNKGEELVDLLERVAHARGRQVTRLDRKR
jgi:hypothetical protein